MSPIIRAEVNPEILVWARESIGLMPSEAAKKARVPTERLLAWETGKAQPTLRQARLLAKAYRRPSAFFYLKVPPVEPPEIPDLRRLPHPVGYMPPQLVYEIRKARFRREIALEMYRALGEPVPDFSLQASFEESSEVVGARMREFLGFSLEEQTSCSSPYDALNAWMSAVEAAGILVFQFSYIDVSLVRGFSIADVPMPTISLNGADSPRARAFTLLHELCHLALGTGGICDLHESGDGVDVEVFSNAAAAAALVPAEAILGIPTVANNRDGPRWSDLQLGDLSTRFQVSKEVILRRLLTLGKTTRAFYRNKREEFKEEYKQLRTQGGGFLPYHRMILRNNGPAFTSLVLDAYQQQAITAIDVSRYLGDIKVNYIPAIQGELANA
ncbi:MAG: XRE family transcriptional regulator [Chloroflexota bacterium]|nr:XRE family transcriptional regulator [Chloroflexota bacterium]